MDAVPISHACNEALEAIQAGQGGWQAAYCQVVHPQTVLDLLQHLAACETAATPQELQRWRELVRDLTGYIKLMSRDKNDPVREDLLLQARQLLDTTGL